jgi:hypothetical protein
VSSVVRVVQSCARVACVRADVSAACFSMRIRNCVSNPERAAVRESV